MPRSQSLALAVLVKIHPSLANVSENLILGLFSYSVETY